MIDTIILCAIPEEVEGLHYTDVFFTGVGKINAAATTEQIIRDYKPKLVINYGTAGSLDLDLKGLVQVTGFVDRDMDARPLNFKLGQTPYEKDVMLGTPKVVCGTGDTFVTKKPEIDCDIDVYYTFQSKEKLFIPFQSQAICFLTFFCAYISDYIPVDG